MSSEKPSQTYFYPLLGSVYDLWFLRISGAGMGNGFYHYFNAVILAEKYGGHVITPAWFSLKIGTIIRRERSKRFYFNVFKPAIGELSGLGKLFRMLAGFSNRNLVRIDGNNEPNVKAGKINTVSCKEFTFNGLYNHRDLIRNRLLAINNTAFSVVNDWGKGGFIGVHVRLGDFVAVQNNAQVAGSHNTRISMEWYKKIILALSVKFPEMPIRIFSDGSEAELSELIDIGASIYSTGSDIGDLLALASSSVLVGSNSTYSYWAAFLGNMPSIWLEGSHYSIKPIENTASLVFVGMDTQEIELNF